MLLKQLAAGNLKLNDSHKTSNDKVNCTISPQYSPLKLSNHSDKKVNISDQASAAFANRQNLKCNFIAISLCTDQYRTVMSVLQSISGLPIQSIYRCSVRITVNIAPYRPFQARISCS